MLDTPLNRRVFAPLLVLLGIALIVRTLVAGGGATALGLIVGVLFVALGALRLHGARRRSG